MSKSYENYPCGYCPQQDDCECFGDPVAALELQGVDVLSFSPISCFFYVCQEGKIEAIKAFRKARDAGQTGRILFGTGHKPFIDIPPAGFDVKGRYIIRLDDSWADYDVIVVQNGQEKRLTNVR